MGIVKDRPYEHAYPTPAQMLILQLIAQGYPDKEIAPILGLSPNTVRTQVGGMLHRINVRSRAHAVAMGYKEGWLP